MMTPAAKTLSLKTGLVAGVFLAVFFFVILPKLASVRKLGAEVNKTFQENQALQAAILTAKNSGDRLEEIQAQLDQHRTKVLFQEDLARTLDEIGSAAQAVRLNVMSLQALDQPRLLPGDPFMDQNLEVQQVRISLKAEGQYPDMIRYFKKLEKMPYPVAVQTVLLKNPVLSITVEGKEPSLAMEVTLAVLMRLPPSKNPVSGG